MVAKLAAIIMAGGRGTRMGELGEKPLVKLAGTGMMRRVLGALRKSKHIGPIIVACSPSTPSTAREARRLGLRVVVAPGWGYSGDLRYVLARSRPERAVVVGADLPLLTAELVDMAVERFLQSEKPTLAVMVPTTMMRELGFEPAYDFEGLSPTGLNVLDKRIMDGDELSELEQETLIISEVSRLVNVNGPADIQKVERLLVKLDRKGGVCR